MPQFFATCPRGLAPALEEELKSFDIGLKAVSEKGSGVSFESSWAKAYEVNLRTKVASRLMKPVLDYQASSEDQIAPNLRKHDFSKYIPLNGSFSLRVKLNARSKYKDQRFIMNRIRVGLLEAFEAKGRSDIKVNPQNPSLEIMVGVKGTTFSYSLNMSGAPLSNRGYRLEGERAPLRENLAAGLIRLTGWDAQQNLVDFMCGSGTFLFEAALLKKPNSLTRAYAFQNWANFDEEAFKEVKKPFHKLVTKRSAPKIHGFDQDPRSIESVFKGLSSLNLSHAVSCKQMALKDLSLKKINLEPGVIILNPPYGARLGDLESAKKTYATIGEKLKAEFKGWKAFILSPHVDLTKELRMKSFFRTEIDNGGITCAFLGYEIN